MRALVQRVSQATVDVEGERVARQGHSVIDDEWPEVRANLRRRFASA